MVVTRVERTPPVLNFSSFGKLAEKQIGVDPFPLEILGLVCALRRIPGHIAAHRPSWLKPVPTITLCLHANLMVTVFPAKAMTTMPISFGHESGSLLRRR